MSDINKTSTSNAERHPALRSSSVPSSCLRSNRDGNCRRASIVRNVSFPADESRIVSGFLEPANPWEYAGNVTTDALIKEYVDSCIKHGVNTLPAVLEQIKQINFDLDRNEVLDLKGSYLTVDHCEALEEVFKRVQFKIVNVESTCLDDEAATSLFDMLEYYESATHLIMSDNPLIDSRGWQACSRMIKRMRCLEILEARSVSLSDQLMPLLTRSLRVGSQLQVLKLENCHLTGRPFLILVSALKLNTNLKELFLGENYLDVNDAAQIGSLLKCNNTLQFLDISNNIILDDGLGHIADGLSEQTGPGLNMLVLWNNHLTHGSAKFISVILAKSSSLEMLNVGQNLLKNDVMYATKEDLQQNHILLKLGMQSTNLTCEGAVALAEVIADNSTLQRVDLRDNNFQIAGLMALSLSMKENMTITQLDLDDAPRRYASDSVLFEYKKLVDEIRGYCLRNKENEMKRLSDQEYVLEENVMDWKKNEPDDYPRLKLSNIDSRKISLTCETLMRHSVITQLEPSKCLTIEATKSSGKLRSPAPSPVPSPVTSPSPTRSRFHVSKVSELSDSFTSTDSNTSSSLSPSSVFGSSRFKVTVVEPDKSSVVISVPSKINTTVGFECSPTAIKYEKDNCQEPKINLPFKLNKPVDSLDIAAMKIVKQPAVETASAPPPRTRKISWVAPSSMFSFSQMQLSIDDTNKSTSSLDRLIGLFKSPFSQFQNKQQSTSNEAVSENESQNQLIFPGDNKKDTLKCTKEEDESLSLNRTELMSSTEVKNCEGSRTQSKKELEGSSLSLINNNMSQKELLFPEEDDAIIVTISENASQCGANSTCVIGLSNVSCSENASSTDYSPDNALFDSTESCGARPASVFSSSDDTSSSFLTTDDVSSSSKEKFRDSTSFSCESSFEKDVSIVKTDEDKVNVTGSSEKEAVDLSLFDLSEKLKLEDYVKSFIKDNTEEISSSNQINNNKFIIESNKDKYKTLISQENEKYMVNDENFSENEGGCEVTEVQSNDGFTSESPFDVNNHFVPKNSEKSREIFQLSDFSEKSVNQSDCNRLYLPCKLATWPQGLGLHLLGRTSCQMDNKYRCSSAPCLVEAATVVLFQRQLPSDLSVKINKLSPTKCDDALESSTNLQMAS